ncbi:MAG TPA: phenylacetic acid degradation protein [Arthrobacter bacterium]|jgi:acyl-CoA thioesterase|nr:phenylacetic acid degradation protein [Arthrobacter sp.]HAP89543.1 phenylacetic acid degradation protein [Arthrobacter sp.]HBH58419.1 phenylacetic acid degradation protein [Arthrobacter sp.]HCB57268.1 phenylacetic acid degradation protein [Arthrobacter sp.]HCC40914.1 phenylacetic acid degradation protein [Arthrobacter sp.]
MAEAALSGATHPILENDYASEWMGIEVLAVSDGHATIRMTLRQEMLNGFGMAHGGMIFAFADSAFALACNPVNPTPAEADSITVAAGVDINFLKPAYRGQVITAVADRRSSAGRSGLYDIQIFAADADTRPDSRLSSDTPGELIAEFRGRSRTIPKK